MPGLDTPGPSSMRLIILFLIVHVTSLELPKISLLQKSPSSPVTCHATGFHPAAAMMFWTKDGEEVTEGVDTGEILPNGDGTFQKSVELDVSSVPPEDWGRYSCVFQLSRVEEPIITKLDKAEIKTNQLFPPKFPVAPVIGAVVGFMLLAIIFIGVFKLKKSGLPSPVYCGDNDHL